jgi:hypothetical protein
MSLAAQLETRVDRSRRGATRRSLRLAAEVPGFETGVTIHNLSVTGMLIETSEELAAGESLLVEIPERGATPATVVWNSGRFFGCQFEERISSASISAALLLNPIGEGSSSPEFEPGRVPLDFDSGAEEADLREYPLPTRLWVIAGLAAASWALVAAAALILI